MTKKLANIVSFQSGVYEKPAPNADTFYLQAIHFDRKGRFDLSVMPQLQLNDKLHKHLLQDNDLLFAAKGLNNFAVVYRSSMGKAVASSSFIVFRLFNESKKIIDPDYLAWFISHDKKIRLLHDQQLGTTIPSLNMKQLAELKIDIPNLETQEKILKVQQLRDKEKELTQYLESYKDKKIQLLLSNALK